MLKRIHQSLLLLLHVRPSIHSVSLSLSIRMLLLLQLRLLLHTFFLSSVSSQSLPYRLLRLPAAIGGFMEVPFVLVQPNYLNEAPTSSSPRLLFPFYDFLSSSFSSFSSVRREVCLLPLFKQTQINDLSFLYRKRSFTLYIKESRCNS